MPNVVSALTARTQFGQIIRRVKEKNERFVVDRRGEPQAVIMSIKDYLGTIAPAPAWLKRSWASAKRSGVAKMSMRDIDAEIRRYRREEGPEPVMRIVFDTNIVVSAMLSPSGTAADAL